MIERIVDEISFDASESSPGTVVTVTKDLVASRMAEMLEDTDLSRFIL